ncbi:hypothetical protein E4U15_002911 [Claviceps sp. LM218 group G6]|nr:hypothetical protein E4U15_002911 [Claviceps sp. LM218 group G6]
MITPSTEELRMYVDSIPHREQVGSHSVSSGGERATGVKADTREPNGLDDNVDQKTLFARELEIVVGHDPDASDDAGEIVPRYLLAMARDMPDVHLN